MHVNVHRQARFIISSDVNIDIFNLTLKRGFSFLYLGIFFILKAYGKLGYIGYSQVIAIQQCRYLFECCLTIKEP